MYILPPYYRDFYLFSAILPQFMPFYRDFSLFHRDFCNFYRDFTMILGSIPWRGAAIFGVFYHAKSFASVLSSAFIKEYFGKRPILSSALKASFFKRSIIYSAF